MKTAIEVPADEVRKVFLLLEDLNSFLHDPQKYGDTERVDQIRRRWNVWKIARGLLSDRLELASLRDLQEEMQNRPSPFENGH